MSENNCKNCGADQGLHHYETNQCPMGGREAPIGQRQLWMTTTYEVDKSNEIDELRSLIADLIESVGRLEEKIDSLTDGTDLEESVRIYGSEK